MPDVQFDYKFLTDGGYGGAFLMTE